MMTCYDACADCREELLGGVWRYRQLAERISLGDMDEDTDFTDDSALSTPQPDAQPDSETAAAAFFDPLYTERTEVRADACCCVRALRSVLTLAVV